ncbi:MAG: hypothetical protein VX675_04595 [Planctomycetota bacterium]|nr:hypothetical protein [Planctomycetota bacterium]
MIKREPAGISRIAIVAAIALLATFIFEGVIFLKSGITDGIWQREDLPEGIESLRALAGVVSIFYLFRYALRSQPTTRVPLLQPGIYGLLLLVVAIAWLVSKVHADFSSDKTIAVQATELLFPVCLISYLLLTCRNRKREEESSEDD